MSKIKITAIVAHYLVINVWTVKKRGEICNELLFYYNKMYRVYNSIIKLILNIYMNSYTYKYKHNTNTTKWLKTKEYRKNTI
jgi:hypothetical protein